MNCDPLARWYRTLEHLGMGRALERRRSEFLSSLCLGEQRALLLGDGDGRFLADLLGVNRAILVDYIDNSAEMLALARRRATVSFGAEEVGRRVRFTRADALAWLPPPGFTYDLIVTHFFLDCLTDQEVDALLDRLKSSLGPATVWIVSEFNQPARGFPAWRARLWIGGLYRAFGALTGLRVRRLPAYGAGLAAHGFRLRKRVAAELELLVSEWWERGGEDFAFDAPVRATVDSTTPKS